MQCEARVNPPRLGEDRKQCSRQSVTNIRGIRLCRQHEKVVLNIFKELFDFDDFYCLSCDRNIMSCECGEED